MSQRAVSVSVNVAAASRLWGCHLVVLVQQTIMRGRRNHNLLGARCSDWQHFHQRLPSQLVGEL